MLLHADRFMCEIREQEKKKQAETLKVLTLFVSFLIYKRMCHVEICFVIECSIMSLIIYIIFHAV